MQALNGAGEINTIHHNHSQHLTKQPGYDIGAQRVSSDDLFKFGLEANILKKRLLLEREPKFWEKDYVKFLKDVCHTDVSDSEDALEKYSISKSADLPMDTGIQHSVNYSENMPIAITADDGSIRVSREQWQAMATQLHLNTKMIEGVTDTIHFQCGLLQSMPSEKLSMSEHHHLERLLHTLSLIHISEPTRPY